LPIHDPLDDDFDRLDLDAAKTLINRKITTLSRQLATEKEGLGFDFPSYSVLRQRAERATAALRLRERKLSRHESAIRRLQNAVRVLRRTELTQAKDISQSKRDLTQAKYQSLHDPMTDLPNRRFFTEHWPMALSTAKRTLKHGALLSIDLDKFKLVNDYHGHSIGDQLLIEVAARLLRCVREIDTVYRLGGDEFAVVLAGLPASRADAAFITQRVARTIVHDVAQSYHLQTVGKANEVPISDRLLTRTISASVGGLIFNGREKSSGQLLRQADEAMYDIKRHGGNGMLVNH